MNSTIKQTEIAESFLYYRGFLSSPASPINDENLHAKTLKTWSECKDLLKDPMGCGYLNGLSLDGDLRVSTLGQTELLRKQISGILKLTEGHEISYCSCFGWSAPSKEVIDCLLRIKRYSLDHDSFPGKEQREKDILFFAACGSITSNQRLQTNINQAFSLARELFSLCERIERIARGVQQCKKMLFSPVERIQVLSPTSD